MGTTVGRRWRSAVPAPRGQDPTAQRTPGGRRAPRTILPMGHPREIRLSWLGAVGPRLREGSEEQPASLAPQEGEKSWGWALVRSLCCPPAHGHSQRWWSGVEALATNPLWITLCSGEGPGSPGGRQADQEPAVCPGCQEGQWDPGVHQEECGQQVEGGSPSPLLCPSEASSGVLCPVLGSPVQER